MTLISNFRVIAGVGPNVHQLGKIETINILLNSYDCVESVDDFFILNEFAYIC